MEFSGFGEDFDEDVREIGRMQEFPLGKPALVDRLNVFKTVVFETLDSFSLQKLNLDYVFLCGMCEQ